MVINLREWSLWDVLLGCLFFVFVMCKVGNLGIYKYVLELVLLKFISIGN